MPRYSICIPTRERHEPLKSAIETVLAQTHGDFELVVQDNCSSPETAEIVRGFSDPRIRYFRSDRRLAMHDNWEEALSHATGDYVMFIGDDDAVMPDCLARADRLLAAIPADCLHWPVHNYYWPDVADPARRNLLTIDLRPGSLWREGFADDPFNANVSFQFPQRPPGTSVFYGPALVKGWFSWRGVRLYTSMYHCLVARRIVDLVRRRCGRFFVDTMPDFASAILNSYFSKTVVHYARALSMGGHCSRSNGGTHGSREALKAAQKVFFAETGITERELIPKEFPPLMWNASILFACFENVRKHAFPDDAAIPYAIQDFIRWAACEVAGEPMFDPEECRKWVIELAHRYGVPESELKFGTVTPYVRPHGVQNDALGRVYYVYIDGETARLCTIVDAVRLASNFSPQSDPIIEAPRPKVSLQALRTAAAGGRK